MLDQKLYIKEGLKIIDKLIDQGNLQAALSGCQELFKVNPYNRKLQKYQKKIEECLISENEKKVKKDIAATLHLWDEKKYDELREIYARLYHYAPHYKPLIDLIEKLNATVSDAQKTERAEFISEAISAVANLLKEKKYSDVITACTELLQFDPLNAASTQYQKEAQERLVDEILEKNSRVLDSTDFERALALESELLAIDPENKRVKQLALQTKAHLAEKTALAEKIHFNESVSRMKELFKNAEYEKVIQACEEIDRLDPRNFTARTFKRKAKSTIRREINMLTLKMLKEAWANLEKQYSQNPNAFVKI